MMNLKVGTMPGKLVEVVVESGTTAEEIFKIAEVTVSNHEIRLDGTVINIEDCVHSGKLLVAMTKIKGNMNTIKVGTMPGKLQEIEYTNGEKAGVLFERAGIALSNHEIRLDGSVIDEDTAIHNGKLLVSMKQIKGNNDVYTTECDEEEIKYLLEQQLPKVINKSDVEMCDDYVVIFKEYVVSQDMFFSVYEEGLANQDMEEVKPTETHECKCNSAVEIIKAKIDYKRETLKYYEESERELRNELYLLETLLEEIK